ncbi:MAG: hypothetical protein ACFE96_13350 [Candidatus Hermodarchaeota archaeon]
MAIEDLIASVHFYFMLVAIVFFSTSMLMVAFHKPKSWLLLHKSFASLGFLTSIIGLIVLGRLVLEIIHGFFGFIIMIIFAVITLLGLIAIQKKNKNVRAVHLWLSRIIYILSLFLIVLGILTLLLQS